MNEQIEDEIVERLAKAMITDFAKACGYTDPVRDDHPLWGSFRREARAAMPAVRDVVAQALRGASDVLEERYPDPNPLASVFQPYVGAQMVRDLRAMADEVVAQPEPEPPQPKMCTWPSCLSEEEQKQLAAYVVADDYGQATPIMPDPQKRCGCVDPTA